MDPMQRMNQSSLYFPPGGRLGFDLCDVLSSDFTRDPRELAASDMTLFASITEMPWFEPITTHDQWNRDPMTWRMDHESIDEQRQIKRVWSRVSVASYEPVAAIAIACAEGLHLLNISLPPQKKWLRHWASIIGRMTSSAMVRAPISVAGWLDEHGLALDCGGLFASHFGSRLHLTFDEPRSPADAWFGSRIVIGPMQAEPNGPAWPRPLFDTEVEWVGPSGIWLLQKTPQDLENGTLLWTHSTGNALRRVVLSVMCEMQARDAMERATQEIISSLRLVTPPR